MKARQTFFLAVLVLLLLPVWEPVYAADIGMGNLDEFDFSGLQEVIDGIFTKEKPNFGELVQELLKGNTEVSIKRLFSSFWQVCIGEITAGKRAMLVILGIGIMAAVFHNLSLAFENRQIADTGYFITYLAFLSITALSFMEACQIAETMLFQLELFMKAMIPAFFLAVSLSAGSISAIGFYKVMLILISLADSMLLKMILPVIKLSTVLMLINYITKEDMLSRLSKIFQTIVSWSLKGMLTITIGMNTMQGLVLPSIDHMKLSLLQKTVSVLPGIGNSAEAVAGLMAQSSQMIKNGIGTAAFFIIAVMVVVPMAKLGILVLMYQISCAMLQPISDKRMVKALSAVGDGSRYLLQLVATAGILYMVTIAIVCVMT
ncbi:MAG: hypothetical protein HFG39_14485 [Lachnospiraceae bacterium]|nr:hypothetical protein [Lachnospiraceae bacterium]